MPPSFADLPPGELVHALAREAMDATGAAFAAVAVLTGGSAPIVTSCAREPALLATFTQTAAPHIHEFVVRAEAYLHAAEPGVWTLGESTLVSLRAGGRARGILFLHGRLGAPDESRSLRAIATYGGLALAWMEATTRAEASERRLERLRASAAEHEEAAALGEAAVALARRACNPVAYLRTQLGIATRVVRDREAREALDRMARGVARLSEVEHDLDRLMRGTGGVFEVRDAVALACRLADVVGVEADLPSIHVRGNPADLARALACLLANAAEAVRRAGGGSVRVTASRDGERVVLAVVDDGVGLQPGTRLFEPGASGWGRAGRGLDRAARLAKRFGGHVEVRPAPDVGTVATISAPAAEAEAPCDLVVEA